MAKIDKMAPGSGRRLKEDDSVVNIADLIEKIASGVTLTGSFAQLRNTPVVGAKTVTTTAAEIFAGASRLASRYMLKVYNNSTTNVYWGASGVTADTGDVIPPGDALILQLDPAMATPIFVISAANANVRVVELA